MRTLCLLLLAVACLPKTCSAQSVCRTCGCSQLQTTSRVECRQMPSVTWQYALHREPVYLAGRSQLTGTQVVCTRDCASGKEVPLWQPTLCPPVATVKLVRFPITSTVPIQVLVEDCCCSKCGAHNLREIPMANSGRTNLIYDPSRERRQVAQVHALQAASATGTGVTSTVVSPYGQPTLAPSTAPSLPVQGQPVPSLPVQGQPLPGQPTLAPPAPSTAPPYSGNYSPGSTVPPAPRDSAAGQPAQVSPAFGLPTSR